MLKEGDLVPGDVVQIDPAHDPVFGGAFMVVTEPKSWGAQGYVPMGVYMQQRNDAQERGGGPDKAEAGPGAVQAFYRCPFEAMERVGQAVWIVESRGEEAGE